MNISIPALFALASALIADRTQALLCLRHARAELDARPSHIVLRMLGLRRDWDHVAPYQVHLAAPEFLSCQQAHVIDSPRVKDILGLARQIRAQGVTEGTVGIPGRTGLVAMIQAERLGVEL